ncbi:hypothetical protein GGF46_001781 [Coemansia sp. RSA 552]|nr:hypothetical protein GGF46_001781 [Coemansia sp. RSA 552]
MEASDLERLVVITGPRAVLPSHCQYRDIRTQCIYRPVVEAGDGSEKLYTKNNLPLFEVLGPGGNALDEDAEQQEDEGPVAAVLRRRRNQQRQLKRERRKTAKNGSSRNEEESEPPLEDTSDAHYQKLHRKPEYIEKRMRNREIELYQYARWQENQRQESERRRQQLLRYSHAHTHHGPNEGPAGVGEAGTQPSSACASPAPGSARVADDSGEAQPGDKAHAPRPRKRARPAASPGPSSGESSPPSNVSADGEAHEVDSEAGHALKPQLRLSEPERKAAHLGGIILEQFLVLSEHLPRQPTLMSPRSDASEDESSGSKSDGDDSSSEAESVGDAGSGAEDAGSEAGDSDAGSTSTGCACCPREFSLPRRLVGQVSKQREAQAPKKG